MRELDLQTLWQEQPDDPHPGGELRGRAHVDYAVPTSQFPLSRPKTGSPPRRFVAVAFGLAATVVVALGLALRPLPPAPVVSGPVAVSAAQRLEDLLAECRTYGNAEWNIPDWKRAEAACSRVLELEPIQPEATALLGRIWKLRGCEENFNTAKDFAAAGRDEQALASFEMVGQDCEVYLLRAGSAAAAVAAEVMRRAGAECHTYVTAKRWEAALPRCALYARVACQTMELSALSPPALMKLKLEGPLNPRTEWRPRDPLFVDFLRAREKVNPHSPLWFCPQVVSLRAPPSPPDPRAIAKEELGRRYAEKDLGRALVLYFSGDLNSATVTVNKVLEQMSKAEHHEAARALLLDLNEAINLYEKGTTYITNDRPEEAALAYRQALEVDARLVLGVLTPTFPEQKTRELDQRVSFIRRSIQDTMTGESYEKGRALADRKDFRGACRLWKLGSSFSRSNIDLLKALTNVCTKRASEALDKAHTCEQLWAALDFAVDGDGFEKMIDEALAHEACH